MPGERLAVKLFRQPPQGRNQERFQRELEIGLGVRHPNIVRYRHTGYFWHPLGRSPYIVMDFVEGKTLAQLSRALDLLGVDKANSLANTVISGIGDALVHLHRKGIVHRDIQPGNILIDERGKAVLLDLGTSKYFEDVGLSSGWEEIGTRRYWAPECLRETDQRWNPQTDVFMLASAMFHVMSGKYLLAEAVDYPQFYKRLEQYRTRSDGRRELRQIPSRLHPLLFDVLLGMLESNPDDRLPAAIVRDLAKHEYSTLARADKASGFPLSAALWLFNTLEDREFLSRIGGHAAGTVLALEEALAISDAATISRACQWGMLRPAPEGASVWLLHPTGSDEPLLNTQIQLEVQTVAGFVRGFVEEQPGKVESVVAARDEVEQLVETGQIRIWRLEHHAVVAYEGHLYLGELPDDPLLEYRFATATGRVAPFWMADQEWRGYSLPLMRSGWDEWT